MIQIHSFSFNPFQENTYLLVNNKNECIIIDAGCYFDEEKKALSDYITENKLQPISFLNTHAHLDHVFGLQYLKQQFPEIIDFWLPPEGCSYRVAVVSIHKNYPGHAKRIMMGIWSFLRQFMYTKFIIVCDDDVNARNWQDVIWAMTTRMDPARDITAITVNRWPHGYGYVANSLYDADDYERVLERARQKCGRVAIANSDAGGDAYAHLAIDQAARAVRELTQ